MIFKVFPNLVDPMSGKDVVLVFGTRTVLNAEAIHGAAVCAYKKLLGL